MRGFDAGVVLGFTKLKPTVLGVSVVAFPKLNPAAAAGLLASIEVAGLEVPNRPPLAGAEIKKDDFAGAGVEAGVVESGLAASAG